MGGYRTGVDPRESLRARSTYLRDASASFCFLGPSLSLIPSRLWLLFVAPGIRVGGDWFLAMTTSNAIGAGDEQALEPSQRFATGSGMELMVERRRNNGQAELLLRARTPRKCVLHWGIRTRDKAGWRILPQQFWP